jgi:hypothetical protein
MVSERLMVAGVASPVVAFGASGTTLVGAQEWMITFGRFAAIPVTIVAVWCLVSLSHLSRTVFGAVLVIWWAGWIWTRTTSDMPVSAFAMLSWVSLPLLAALSLGKAWSIDAEKVRADV